MTIAHRLRTVVDYNRVRLVQSLSRRVFVTLFTSQVLLLDEGRIVEFDSPAVLLSDPSSRFYALCKVTGKTEFSILKRLAGVSGS